jgi:hypothetical protein
MKLASAIEGGLTGATTLTLLQEALHRMDTKSPRPFLNKSSIIKDLKRAGHKGSDNKLYIKLAGELLTGAAYFGLAGFGKKENVILRGGLLGAAAGLGSAFLHDNEEKSEQVDGALVDNKLQHNSTKNKILTVTLYTVGGLLAGTAIKRLNEGSKGKKGKKKNKKNKGA